MKNLPKQWITIKAKIPWYKRILNPKINKYEKYISKVVQHEMEKHQKEISACMTNQLLYGHCDGSCGLPWCKGIYETPNQIN